MIGIGETAATSTGNRTPMVIRDAPVGLADKVDVWATFVSFVGAALTAASVMVLF